MLVAAGLAFAPVLSAVGVVLEAGMSYAATSGVRRYAAPDLSHSSTSNVAVPFLRASTMPSPNWHIGVRYSYIADLKGRGVSPDSNIFKDPSLVALPVITPFTSKEDIHEISLDLRYSWQLAKGLAFQLGPVGSVFHSRAKISWRSFSDTEFRLGGVADLRYSMSSQWQLALGVRYARPTDRDITLYSISGAYRF